MKKLTTKEIFHKITGVKNGSWVRLTKEKWVEGVQKITEMTIRLGVDYTHMKEGKKDAGKLPWGQWLNGLEGIVIEYKGHYYLRVANAYTKNSTSHYFIDGQEVSKDKVIALIGGKKISSDESPIYNIKFENIIDIK